MEWGDRTGGQISPPSWIAHDATSLASSFPLPVCMALPPVAGGRTDRGSTTNLFSSGRKSYSDSPLCRTWPCAHGPSQIGNDLSSVLASGQPTLRLLLSSTIPVESVQTVRSRRPVRPESTPLVGYARSQSEPSLDDWLCGLLCFRLDSFAVGRTSVVGRSVPDCTAERPTPLPG